MNTAVTTYWWSVKVGGYQSNGRARKSGLFLFQRGPGDLHMTSQTVEKVSFSNCDISGNIQDFRTVPFATPRWKSIFTNNWKIWYLPSQENIGNSWWILAQNWKIKIENRGLFLGIVYFWAQMVYRWSEPEFILLLKNTIIFPSMIVEGSGSSKIPTIFQSKIHAKWLASERS